MPVHGKKIFFQRRNFFVQLKKPDDSKWLDFLDDMDCQELKIQAKTQTRLCLYENLNKTAKKIILDKFDSDNWK